MSSFWSNEQAAITQPPRAQNSMPEVTNEVFVDFHFIEKFKKARNTFDSLCMKLAKTEPKLDLISLMNN